jgi:predicted O-linked N-acetylglucosamine transferase (SPINDLY family)
MSATPRLDAARRQFAGGDIAGARHAAELIVQAPVDTREAAGAQLVLVECSRRERNPRAAIAHAQAAIAATPDDALTHYALAIAQDESGDQAGAIANMRRALGLDPTMVKAQRYLGTLLLDVGDAPGATESLQRAVELDPNHADAWNNLGTALHSANRPVEAEQAYQRSLALKPDYPWAVCNLALLQRDQGRTDLAEATLRASIARQPPPAVVFGGVLTALADLLRSKSALDEAAELYLRAARQSPNASTSEMLNLGNVLVERGDHVQAGKAYGHALQQNPRYLRAALAQRLTLPMIYADTADLMRAREGFVHGLQALERDLDGIIAGSTPREITDGLIWSNFFLAYQGQNDKALQTRYAALAARALDRADPAWRAPIAAGAVTGRRIRIGFVSALLRHGTVGQYFARWLTDLDRDQFELCFYPLGGGLDDVTTAIGQRADRVRPFIGGDTIPSVIGRGIRAEQLDMLVYPELGMDQVTFALAGMRLAPRQYAAWGHPVTTGHRAIDAFFSCDVMEPPDGESHYTERLVRLPGIGTRFARPVLPPRPARAALGLPDGVTLVLCPQSLFKIHPDNDVLFARVLAANPEVRLVLFEGRHPAVTDQFMRRLAKCFAAHGLAIRERTLVLPQLSHEGFLAVNLSCDLMLDTMFWSGGQTSVDALDCGLPVVTLPGAMMRGRQSAGMLRLIGADELIARDVDDYVRIATRLCSDPEWRLALSARIRDASSRLFDDAAPIAALQAFYREEAARPVG